MTVTTNTPEVKNGKTQTPPVMTPKVETPKESTPSVETPKVAESPKVEATPEVKPAEESKESEAPKFDAEILNKIDYRWLAGLMTQATNETTPLLVGNRHSLASQAQTSLVATIDGVTMKAIENFKPNLDPDNGPVEAYLIGEVFKNGKGENQTVLASETPGKYLNAAGIAQKSLVDQIKKWYDNPQDSYEQDTDGSTIVRDMVRAGILARFFNVLVTSIFGTGKADTMRSIKFVNLLSNSAEEKQALLWELIPFATFDGMSLAGMKRDRVYASAKNRLADISDMFGLAPKTEASAKADNGDNPKPVVTANAFAALAGRVSEPTKTSPKSARQTTESNPSPTGNPVDPMQYTKPGTRQSTVVNGTDSAPAKIDNPPVVEPAAKSDTPAETPKSESPAEKPADDSKPAESAKTPDPVVEPIKETPAETAK